MAKDTTSNPAPGFNIGAVSRMTGIARERIRIWERRYEVVVPDRDSGNKRLYSQDDVDRLRLIRSLVDGGHAIGQIARLSAMELQARQAAAVRSTGSGGTPEQTLVLGPEAESLAAQLRAWQLPAVATVADLAEATRWLAERATELIIAAYPTITHQELTGLVQLHRSTPQCTLLVVYRFAPDRLLDQLTRLGIRPMKAPLAVGDLNLPPPARPPREPGQATQDYRARQFNGQELQRFTELRGAVACECPQHLANLVRDLQAFEDYTLACEVATPADAALHREVYDVIARARALTEDALGIIAAEEGLSGPAR